MGSVGALVSSASLRGAPCPEVGWGWAETAGCSLQPVPAHLITEQGLNQLPCAAAVPFNPFRNQKVISMDALVLRLCDQAMAPALPQSCLHLGGHGGL